MLTDPRLLRVMGRVFGTLSTALSVLSGVLWIAEAAAHYEANRQDQMKALDDAPTEVNHAR